MTRFLPVIWSALCATRPLPRKPCPHGFGFARCMAARYDNMPAPGQARHRGTGQPAFTQA
ncbi:hypothetical protein [Komagataeibacter sp. NFXK3]